MFDLASAFAPPDYHQFFNISPFDRPFKTITVKVNNKQYDFRITWEDEGKEVEVRLPEMCSWVPVGILNDSNRIDGSAELAKLTNAMLDRFQSGKLFYVYDVA